VNGLPWSRRAFESRFKKLLGRTPREAIARIRINRVKEGLTETDLALAEIAERFFRIDSPPETMAVTGDHSVKWVAAAPP
jgi:hypothetical protein